MTDLITPSPAGGEAAPQDQTSEETTAQGQTQETQKAEPKPVTVDDLKQFGDALVRRFTQSSRDREKAIKKEVDGLRQQMTAAGITPTAEQEQKLRETVAQKYEDTEEEETDEAQDVQASTPATDQAIRYLNDQISDVFAEIGTTVQKGDPEFKDLQAAVDKFWTDPKGLAKILIATQKAATAKQARLQQNSRGAAGRVTGASGERTTTTPTLSARDKISRGLKGPYNQGPPPGR